MKKTQRGLLVRHLSETDLVQAIEDAQQADETRLVRRLCFIKNLYQGENQSQKIILATVVWSGSSLP